MIPELQQENERLRRANTGYSKVTAQLAAERNEWKSRAELAEARLAKILALCAALAPEDGQT